MKLCDVSVIITSYNEEANIARCLEPLNEFREVVVVDSFSSDRTVAIARSYGATIYQRPYASAAKQKNWALDRVHNPWVLILDADEAVTGGMLDEIRGIDVDAADGYWVRRDSEYLGRPIRHCGWQRDKVLRLFRREMGRYVQLEVHEEVKLDGRLGMLRGRLLHFPYHRVEQHLNKIQSYSTRGATDYIQRGGRHPLAQMLWRPPFRFLRQYVMQRGFLDGREGFLLCLLSSYSVFLKYAKAWELHNCHGGN